MQCAQHHIGILLGRYSLPPTDIFMFTIQKITPKFEQVINNDIFSITVVFYLEEMGDISKRNIKESYEAQREHIQ